MIVLDTHAWLWWIAGDERLSAAAGQAIDAEPTVGICSISCWEVAMLVARGRVTLTEDVTAWVEQTLAIPGVELLPLSAKAAVMAGSNAMQLHGDPADRMIAATAIEHGARLVTRDEKLRAFPDVQTIW